MAMLPHFLPFLLPVKSYPHVPFPFHFVAFMDGQTKYARISFLLLLVSAIIVLRASFERLGLILF